MITTFLNKKNSFSLLFFCIALAIFLLPSFAFAAANLNLNPNIITRGVGENFTVSLRVDGGGDQMNAVEASLSYDSSKLSVVNITKEGSVFTLWTTEPTFSNADGTITFGGGSPTPFSGNATLAVVTFRPIAEGDAEVQFTQGSVLAADGKGTDILGTLGSATYTITPEADEPEEEPVSGTGTTPRAPAITSSTHSDPEGWYNKTVGEFEWVLPIDAVATRLLIGTIPDATPTVEYDPPIATKTLDDLEEGVWYFHVQIRNGKGWGDITHRKIQIDVTPPLEFEVTVDEEGATSSTPTLLFSTTDELSGLSKYEIVIGGGETIEVPAEDITDGRYEMPEQDKGEYAVTVTAYDRAGNTSSSEVTVTVEEERQASSRGPVEFEEEGPSFMERYGNIIFILFLLSVIIALFITILFMRQKHNAEKRRAIEEAREAENKMEIIFSTLRDEVEDQVRQLSAKARLSDAEKRVLVKLREALDISEEFIDKEISDIEKVLK
ncbi:MAG: cohesin domain-containing protein [Candidatus Paceibacterota bacterium]